MISVELLERVAPNQASLVAARKPLRPSQWPVVARDAAGGLLWSECQRSGSAPCRLAVSLPEPAFRRSCLSRKQPCKHVLALMWLLAETPDLFPDLMAATLRHADLADGAAANGIALERGGIAPAA